MNELSGPGFLIRGCIDGWSRKNDVANSQKVEQPSRSYFQFLNCVAGLEGCPVKLKTDCGTENGAMAAFQCTFQQDAEAHKYGSSPMNQRIEGWGSLSEAYTLTLGNGDLSVYRPMNGEEFGD